MYIKKYVIPQYEAIEIAHIAKDLKTESVLDSTGYYVIAEYDDKNVAVDVSKNEKGYAVYVDYYDDNDNESDWLSTETYDTEELVDLILDVALRFVDDEERKEKERHNQLETRRKKKKYHVVMRSVEYYGIDVEAYDKEEAMELAEEVDGGEFIFEDNTPWEVAEVREYEE